jgi:hypothetical protein
LRLEETIWREVPGTLGEMELRSDLPAQLSEDLVYDVIRADLELDDARHDPNEVEAVLAEESSAIRLAACAILATFAQQGCASTD